MENVDASKGADGGGPSAGHRVGVGAGDRSGVGVSIGAGAHPTSTSTLATIANDLRTPPD